MNSDTGCMRGDTFHTFSRKGREANFNSFRWKKQLKESGRCLLIGYFILLLLFFPSAAWSTEEQSRDAGMQFAFAEALLSVGDYYRAITEYKRFVFFYPKNELVEKSTFRIAESYFKARRWTEAIDAFDSFRSKYPHNLMVMEALYLEGLAEKELKRYENALSTFQVIIDSKSEHYADKAIYQTALILLDSGDWHKAKKTFSLIPDNSSLSSSAHIMSTGLERMDDIPQKSPTTAGVLAAVLPGAGHVYTERYRDAVMAFLLNGAFIVAAVELFRHDNPVAGGVVTFFELGWYSGNIYSAVSSAHKYNEREKNTFIQNLKDSSGFSLSYDPVTSSPQLVFSFRY